MNPDVNSLIKRIEALEKWKAEKERQQLKYPLDSVSVAVLQNYFMRITGSYQTLGGLSGNLYTTYVGSQGDFDFEVTQQLLVPYTANASTDTITVADGRFAVDRLVYVATSDTAPGGLSTSDTYYTINVTNGGTSFQLSATQGGAAINITSSGTGRQFIGYVLN